MIKGSIAALSMSAFASSAWAATVLDGDTYSFEVLSSGSSVYSTTDTADVGSVDINVLFSVLSVDVNGDLGPEVAIAFGTGYTFSATLADALGSPVSLVFSGLDFGGLNVIGFDLDPTGLFTGVTASVSGDTLTLSFSDQLVSGQAGDLLAGGSFVIQTSPAAQQLARLLRYLALQERVGDLKSTAATLTRLSTGLAANNARAGVANSFATRDRLPAFDLASGAPVVVSTKNGKLVGKVHTWMEFSGFLARQDSSRKFTGTGVQLGADIALSPTWVLGVSAGNDDLNARTPLGTTEGDFTFAQPYLGYQRGDWSGELSLLYGEADYTQTTVGGQGTADSEVWSVNLSLARNIALSDTTRLTPMGSVHYGEETITGTGGTLALAGKSTVDFSEYSLGARLTHETGEGMSYVGLHADYVASGAAVALAGRGFDPEGLSGRIELGTGFPISGNGNVALGVEAGGLGSNLTEYTGQIRVSFEF